MAVDRLDAFINGENVALPPADARKAADQALGHDSASVRVASLFFALYSVIEPRWNCDSVPTGVSGQHGDKRLTEAMNKRHGTLHNAITAFGENLGWKGNVGT